MRLRYLSFILNLSILLIIFFQLSPGFVAAQNPKVGFLQASDIKNSDPEIQAVWKYLKGNKKIKSFPLTFSELGKKGISLKKADVIWFHRVDSSEFNDNEIAPKAVANLKKYLSEGGNLFLSQDAFRYIEILGIEPRKPEVRYVNATDQGYGRKLGLHSFRSHPVFDGLNGGAYLFAPDRDIKVRQVGFFDRSYPFNGRVVAVDWVYILLKENSRLVVEYDYGKGKIFAVGAYMYFDQKSNYRDHLELFTNNIFHYLADKKFNPDIHYWDQSVNHVFPFRSKSDPLPLNISEKWMPKDSPLTLENKLASGNFWDVAGERLVAMGKEKGGIDEIWAYPFMALRDYEVGIKFANQDTILWLNDQSSQIKVRPESFSREYKFENAGLAEIVVVSPDKPAAVVHYKYHGSSSAKLIVRFKSNLRYMWPYSEKVLGDINFAWDKGLNAFVIKDKSEDFVTVAGTNKLPNQQFIGPFDGFTQEYNWVDGKYQKDTVFSPQITDKFQVDALQEFNLRTDDNLDIMIAASGEGVDKTIEYYREVSENPLEVYNQSVKKNINLLTNQLTITTPDSLFNLGYRWAMVGADRFYVNIPGVGKSLVAGYQTTDEGWDGGHAVNGRPGYAWYFGRDGEWSGLALLDEGDFDKVRNVLETYQRFQDLNGKIYHELTTSGVVHYDAADATPLYLILAGKYLHHSGDVEFIRSNWNHIRRALDFCFSTDTDGDHLIENTLVGHGWEEGGGLFGTHSTLYLSSCWAEALEQSAFMAKAIGLEKEAEKYADESKTVCNIINTSFWNTDSNYFFHGKFKDGRFMNEVSIMPGIPLYFNQIEKDKTVPVLRRFAGNDFTTNWGARIVEEKNPMFHPDGYHTGSVWPLFTGWTSLAEYRNGRPVQGYSHLINNLLGYKNWGLGFVDEVLNGSEYKPSGVCRHQCWSETMVLQPAIEGMLGLKIDALDNRIELSPDFTANWDKVSVQNIRMGNQWIDMVYRKEKDKISFRFSLHPVPGDTIRKPLINLMPNYPAGCSVSRVMLNGKIYALEGINTSKQILFALRDTATVEIMQKGGIAVVPVVENPKPSDKPEGLRVISDEMNDQGYAVTLQGKSGESYEFRVWTDENDITSVENAVIVSRQGKLTTINVDFPPADQKYTFKVVTIKQKTNDK